MTGPTPSLAARAAAAFARLSEMATALYEHHADACEVCCILGGEFCATGDLLQCCSEDLEAKALTADSADALAAAH